MTDGRTAINELFGREVVLDVTGPYVYAGTLTGEDARYFVLEEADVHDLRDSTATRELYVLDIQTHGVRVNRRRVLVRKEEVVSVSLLEDVSA